ncbi:VOC family protein [Streptomyces sp. TRM72054]|uniref:VOC family protein n=1 Tax=Streptomyces TaxID=1883 RepID=UPI0014878399|nr:MULTISPECIES: VOC family protein [unclassified Streptomyces]MBX9393672.1 VOC family protein [Streptomyces sp. TRM72054]
MYDPAQGFPHVVVELAYADPDGAVDWLVQVFGFRLLLKQPVSGAVQHADLDTGGGIVMVRPTGGRHSGTCTGGHTCKQIIVWVPDVDEHFARSTAAGAHIVQPLMDKPWGLRQYLVRDLEGHLWEFTQHLRDVPPHEWGAVAFT